MCGLATIFSRMGPAPLDALERMSAALAMRGPDASGSWVSKTGEVAFAHRRLSIIDLSSAGNQPMVSTHGHVIVFNGEIYNFRALRLELVGLGATFTSESDTEVLLEGYRYWGEELPRKLVGMFSFCIWDSVKRCVFVARDHFGIKPLYVYEGQKYIVIASTVSAVIASGLASAELSPAGGVGFFLWGAVPEPYSLYQNIRSLQPGTTMTIHSDGRVVRRTYWALGAVVASAREERGNETELAMVLRSALQGSIHRHLVSDVPVALFLSAGRDSSTIAALAGEVQRDMLAITLGFSEFKGGAKDEVGLASKVAGHYGYRHYVKWMSADDFADDEDKFFSSMDQPTIDGVNSYFVSKAAAAAGAKVALSGLGADELLAGYPSFRQLPRLVRGVGLLGHLGRIGRFAGGISEKLIPVNASPKIRGIPEYGGTWGGAYLLRRSLFMPWELESIIDPDFARCGLAELSVVDELNKQVAGLKTDRARVMAFELAVYMRNMLLRDSDWASMANAVELRVPFVDVRLFEELLPFIIGDGRGNVLGKNHLPKVVGKPFPVGVADRPKTGFEVPVRDWMSQRERMPVGRGLRGWSQLVARKFGLPVV